MRLTLGIRSLVAVAAAGALLSAMGRPALAQVVPVIITADPVNLPNWATQAINMGKTIAADAQRYLQLEKEIAQAKQNLEYLGKLAYGSLGSLQKFSNFVVTAQNEYPTTAGYDVATTIVAEQNGSLSSNTLGTLQSEILGAQGNLQVQQANADLGLANLTQAGNQLKFEAAQATMTKAQTDDAALTRAALLDTNSAPTAGMLY